MIRKHTIASITLFALMISACSNANNNGANKNGLESNAQISISEETYALPEDAITFSYANHLYFNITLRDSIPARMIFDTGNTNILLDSEFYAKHFAHLGTLRKAMARGAGAGSQAANLDISGWEYRIGNYKQKEQTAVVLDLRKILGDNVDGMFGMAFMRDRKVEFNYINEYMRIVQPEEQAAEGYVCVKCEWLDNGKTRMLLPLNITIKEGIAFDGKFLVDMGASNAISINSNKATELKLQSALTTKEKIYDTGGVGGSRTDYLFKAQSITIAGCKISDLDASYTGNEQGASADKRYDGIIGNALLEHFDVIFDFSKCEIWFRPNKNINAIAKYDSGITLTPKADYWVVNGLIEGGNANKAGVKRGDIILTINGESPKTIDYKKMKEMNLSADAWIIVVKRGDTTTEIKFEKES